LYFYSVKFLPYFGFIQTLLTGFEKQRPIEFNYSFAPGIIYIADTTDLSAATEKHCTKRLGRAKPWDTKAGNYLLALMQGNLLGAISKSCTVAGNIEHLSLETFSCGKRLLTLFQEPHGPVIIQPLFPTMFADFIGCFNGLPIICFGLAQ
jgi:hypothetical protein